MAKYYTDFEEAKVWHYGARAVFDSRLKEPECYTVAIAMCIHALIKANDALTVRFLGRRAFRHDEAPQLFLMLIEQGKINKEYARMRELLQRAVMTKSLADYRGLKVTRLRAAEWLADSNKFIEIVKKCLE